MISFDEKTLNEFRCELFKSLRKFSKMTQEQFAKKYHLSVRTIQNWESYRNAPTDGYLHLLKKQVARDNGLIDIREDGTQYIDYILENGEELYSSSWNGEVYNCDTYRYRPVQVPINYYEDEPDQWETIGFEQLI